MTRLKKLLVVNCSLFMLIAFIYPTATEVSAASSSNKNSQAKNKKYYRTVKRKKSDKLLILNEMPNSGIAREAGYDGSIAMESTSKLDSEYTLCAKASRGLIMLDNTQLRKCGGRPKGWSKGANKK